MHVKPAALVLQQQSVVANRLLQEQAQNVPLNPSVPSVASWTKIFSRLTRSVVACMSLTLSSASAPTLSCSTGRLSWLSATLVHQVGEQGHEEVQQATRFVLPAVPVHRRLLAHRTLSLLLAMPTVKTRGHIQQSMYIPVLFMLHMSSTSVRISLARLASIHQYNKGFTTYPLPV